MLTIMLTNLTINFHHFHNLSSDFVAHTPKQTDQEFLANDAKVQVIARQSYINLCLKKKFRFVLTRYISFHQHYKIKFFMLIFFIKDISM